MTESTTTPTQPPFDATQDPSGYTVTQVTDYLATASAEDAATVKTAEGAPGAKNRRGILEYAPAADQVEADEDGYTRVLVDDAYQPGEPIERDEDDDTQE